MWLAIVGAALAADRMMTVTDKVTLDAPVALTWIKLATEPGISTLEESEPLPDGEGRVLDAMGDKIPALEGGKPGVFVVVAIDGPRWIRLRWESDDRTEWKVIDLTLREYKQGTELEATVAWPLSSGITRRDVAADLARGLEAFAISVDGWGA